MRMKDRTSERALTLIAEWIAAQVERIGARGCVFGVSGGVDSSLVALLLHRARVPDTLAFIMPCGSAPEDARDARRLCRALGIRTRTVDVAPMVEQITGVMSRARGPRQRLIAGNLASRLRQDLLYYEANRSGRLVIGTGDLDETYVGYSSKGATADLFPITGLHKDEVRALLRRGLTPIDAALADQLSAKPASPGYWPGQEAEHELGLSYARIAAALDVIIGQCEITELGVVPFDEGALRQALSEREVAGEDVLRVAALLTQNHHKSFGSPALWRPEPCAAPGLDEER